MSGLDSRQDVSYDTDEDNNPFSGGGLASLLQNSHIKDKHPSGTNMRKKETSTNQLTRISSGPGSQTEDMSSGEEGGSLLLNQGEEVNTIHIDHETRVSRLLALDKHAHVVIKEAGKSNEGMANSSKKYIVYTITLTDSQSDEVQTRRRYSDFESLRSVLTRIFPLVIIPPIPPKSYHTNVLKGLVGSAASGNESTSSIGLGSLSGVDTSQNNAPSYSYINSNYLNGGRLIEHRKRLLANFLNNCLSIPQIRKIDFFTKFLDPSANWSDEVTFIKSKLPESIYQSNPENGISTDPVYANLPMPVSNHSISLPFSNPLKNRFFQRNHHGTASADPQVSTNSQETSENLSHAQDSEISAESGSRTDVQTSVVNKTHLDDINRRIMSNFIGLSNDYIELGAFLNSFSMVLADTARVGYVENTLNQDVKLDSTFDRIGAAYDSSLSTINSLIAEWETKFSEPLGESVKYTSVFESTRKFRDRKLKQSSLVDLELKEKKKELADCLRADMEVSKIEKGLQSRSFNKTPSYSLGASHHHAAAPEPAISKSRFMPNIGSVKKLTKYVSDLVDQNPELSRKQKIKSLQERMSTLKKCQGIMLQDVSYIIDELSKNAEKFRKSELTSMFEILLNYNRIFIAWAKQNVEIWEEAREDINSSSK